MDTACASQLKRVIYSERDIVPNQMPKGRVMPGEWGRGPLDDHTGRSGDYVEAMDEVLRPRVVFFIELMATVSPLPAPLEACLTGSHNLATQPRYRSRGVRP